MELKELKEILKMISSSQFEEFELKNGEFYLRTRRGDNRPRTTPEPPTSAPAPVAVVPGTASVPATPETEAAPADAKAHLVNSPLIGTFYRAPSPGAEPFVQPGARVKPGTVLCIVEAMKIMNEIECDVAGVVEKVWVENGEPVEYGEHLFTVRLD
ncbi:MAG TPA: acetyl-CoA carboxylase biotin carboxyl carrier protein [Acidobacteriota bacterium]|nr:acetyl-CoA carboxylase biotin carboxyl carrier protein [Acidobacteriota bacterium]HQO24100.1 acetyl-CoA carboxylase biotin carboxyl carrier protein [Acidobacteriota bacterium]HQP72830.1 acetyl-CoA carboxylase biotin carboxyl carrier protein [Acidobacteriota bacterium]